ncbi:RDD family protein [Geofilum sp. OHC36d9]|uniref:RDD family protein n=1 Tax=Geofilum sp. OHC36d9 TaxID=3458413 RepID=UPI0040335DE9
METYQLNTSQNVTLEYPIASVGDRLLSTLLDQLISGIYLLGALIIFVQLDIDFAIWQLIFLIPIFLYHFIFELLFNGQSPGKMILRTKVIKTDGSALTAGSCFIRWIFRLVDITIFMGAIAVLIIILNGKGQRLGDLAAATTVLKLPRKKDLKTSIWQEIEDNYEPQFRQVEYLSDEDIRTVKEVLEISGRQKNESKKEKIQRKACQAIAKKIAVESNLSDTEFLETIIKDYNAIHQIR